MKIALKTLLIVWKIIVGFFLTYAVVFALVGTYSLFYLYNYISKPLKEVKLLQKSNPPQSRYMAKFKKELQSKKEPDSLLHSIVPLDSISPHLIKAVIAAEDDGFYIHPGFDLSAMLRAFEHNKTKNRISHGASTITQQMAKNFFVGGEKNFQRKYMELVYTILMEKYLGKDRILELYLNYAQWGKNIFGCEAASQFYYKKPSKHLTIDQASRLAAVLAKPSKLNPHYTKSQFIQKRLRVIGDNMYRKSQITETTYTDLTGTDSLVLWRNSKSKNSFKDSIQTLRNPEKHKKGISPGNTRRTY